MRRWLQRLIAFRAAHRAQVLDALTPMVGPYEPRVSWRVQKGEPRIKTFADWDRRHGQRKAS